MRKYLTKKQIGNAKVFLICGNICSGKTTYAKRLAALKKAVILSCDEIESCLFDKALGDRHDEKAVAIKAYLHKKAVETVSCGCSVILDWGFWSSEERKQVSNYYSSCGIEYEWHYIDISEEGRRRNSAVRNQAVSDGKCDDYFIDEGLWEKSDRLFEKPERKDMDVWFVNEIRD